MATDVVMPKLGLTMERGTITAWLKQEGDTVRKGEPLLEVETDKVTMEVEAQVDGVVGRILVDAGVEVDVATSIAILIAPGERLETTVDSSTAGTDGANPNPKTDHATAGPRHEVAEALDTVSAAPGPASEPPKQETGPAQGSRPHRASPKARKMAAERGLDLTSIVGSGPGGRVVSADLENVVQATKSPTGVAPTDLKTTEASTAVVDLSRAQQVAAERLTASYQQAPHIQLRMEVAAHWLEQFRAGYAAEGKRISYNDFLLRAVALTLAQHPRLNSHFVEGRVHQLPSIDLGIATDTDEGLLVPILRDVLPRTVEDISVESRRLVELARQGRLGVDDMTGGSFTVTNLGMLEISSFSAIINPPQVAILAVGAVERRVVPLDDQGAIGVRPMMTLNLAADHRAIDGAMGARFLLRLRDTLQSPTLLA